MRSTHPWATDRQRRRPRGSLGAGAKAGSPGCGSRPPRLTQQRRARQAHTHPPQSAALRESPPRGHTPTPIGAAHPGLARTRPSGQKHNVPSNTQSTSRATYGSRVLSNMVRPGGPALKAGGTGFTSPGQALATATSYSSSQPGKSSRGRTGTRRRSDGQQWRPGPLPSQVPQPLGRGRDTRLSAAAAPWPQALLCRPWPARVIRWPYPGPLSNRRGVWTRALRMGPVGRRNAGSAPPAGQRRTRQQAVARAERKWQGRGHQQAATGRNQGENPTPGRSSQSAPPAAPRTCGACPLK